MKVIRTMKTNPSGISYGPARLAAEAAGKRQYSTWDETSPIVLPLSSENLGVAMEAHSFPPELGDHFAI
jgi:hypothetical protein